MSQVKRRREGDNEPSLAPDFDYIHHNIKKFIPSRADTHNNNLRNRTRVRMRVGSILA